MMKTRLANSKDLIRINEICNQAIADQFKVARFKPFNEQDRIDWWHSCDRNAYPVFVCENDEEVVGWLALNPYRPGREALEETAILSYFVDYDHLGKGIGSALIQHMLEQPLEAIRVVFAIIIEGNEASIGLLKKFGFDEWAMLPEVIHAHDEIRSQVYLGKILKSNINKL